MPQVPYSPVPSVALQGGGTPRFSPQGVTEEAFGGTVGSAINTLGKTIAGAGDELAKRAIAMQELANETEAKEAESRYIIKSGQMRAEYHALTGSDAVKAYPSYMDNLRKAREEIRGTLSNPASQRLYDGPSMNTMSYTIVTGAGHSATEQKNWTIGAAAARKEIYKNDAAAYPDDDAAFQRRVVDTVRQNKEIGDITGAPPEKVELAARVDTSQMWLSRIVGMAKNKPFEAKDMFEAAKKRGDLLGPDIEKANNSVTQQIYGAGSRIISNEITDSDPDGNTTLTERIAKAEDKAEKILPDDPLFKDYARQRVSSDWAVKERAKRFDDYNRRQTVEGGLMEGKDGPPTTIEELKADPKVSAAWDGLDKTTQRRYLGVLAKNAKGDLNWDEDRLRRYQELKGIAASDPAKLLEMDVVNEDLPWSARKELVAQQQKIKSNAEGDPRVSKALQILGPDLNAAGVSKRANDRQYFQYVGALQDSITDFQKENKRAPKADELQTIGRRLLQEQATGRPGWIGAATFGLIATEEKGRVFELPVPERDMQEIEERIKQKAPGVEPTKELIQRVYVREQFRKFYGGTPSSAKPSGDPTVPKPPVSK